MRQLWSYLPNFEFIDAILDILTVTVIAATLPFVLLWHSIMAALRHILALCEQRDTGLAGLIVGCIFWFTVIGTWFSTHKVLLVTIWRLIL